jgi:hypothetical protein
MPHDAPVALLPTLLCPDPKKPENAAAAAPARDSTEDQQAGWGMFATGGAYDSTIFQWTAPPQSSLWGSTPA